MEKVIYQAYPHFYDRMETFVKENETVKECDVCFVGDSLVEMMGLSFFHDKKVVNRGIISDKTAGVLMTLNDRVIATHPKTVFFLCGTNDICDGYTLKQIENNLKDIIAMLQESNPEIKIILSTILPPCYHEAPHVDKIYPDCRDILRIHGLNEIIKSFANDKVKIFDAYSILSDETDSLKTEDTLDGVHITPNAYLKLFDKLKDIL